MFLKRIFTKLEQAISYLENSKVPLSGIFLSFFFAATLRSFIEVFSDRTIIHLLQFDFLKVRLQKWVNEGAKDLLEGVWIVSTNCVKFVSFIFVVSFLFRTILFSLAMYH